MLASEICVFFVFFFVFFCVFFVILESLLLKSVFFCVFFCIFGYGFSVIFLCSICVFSVFFPRPGGVMLGIWPRVLNLSGKWLVLYWYTRYE